MTDRATPQFDTTIASEDWRESMLDDIHVRTATAHDAGAVGRIHVSSWRAAYDGIVSRAFLDALQVSEKVVLWQQILSDPVKAANVCVAETPRPTSDDSSTPRQVVGFVSFGDTTARPADGDAEGRVPSSSTAAEVRAIYIDPACWSQGIGQRLLAAAEQRLADAKFATVLVWVLASNERATRFYEAAGFVRGALDQTEIGGITLPTMQLNKTLRA